MAGKVTPLITYNNLFIISNNMAASAQLWKSIITSLLLSLFLSGCVANPRPADKVPTAPITAEAPVANVTPPAASPAANENSSATIAELALHKPIERELAGGKADSYRIKLMADQFLHLIVEQKGIDVAVTIFGPDEKQRIQVDSPNGDNGPEIASLLADQAGNYRVEVRSSDESAPAGHYEIKVAELRAAKPGDQDLIAAEKASLDASLLANQQNEDAWKNGLALYQEALRLWRSLANQEKVADSLFGIGELYDRLGEGDKAMENYQQALTIRQAIGDRMGEALALNNIGTIYNVAGARRKALDLFNRSLPLFRALNNRNEEAMTLLNIGITHQQLGETAKALDNLNQALLLWRQLGDKLSEANTLNSLGEVYKLQGEIPKVLTVYQQALLLSRAAGNLNSEAVILNNLGAVYKEIGDIQQALDYYNQALPIRQTIKDRIGAAFTLNNLGAAYVYLGEYQFALDYYQQALDIEGSQDPVNQAATLTGIGDLYLHQGENSKALDYYTQSLPVRRATGNRYGEAITLREIGLAWQKLGNREQALDSFNQSLALRRAIGDRLGQVKTLIEIGFLDTDSKDYQNALAALTESLSISRAIYYRAGEARALYGSARVARAQNNFQAARDNIEAALQIIESLRAKVNSQDLRSSYFATVQEYYEFYKDLLMTQHQRQPKLGYDRIALAINERARARSLLELLAESGADIQQGLDPQLLEQARALQQQLNFTVTQQLLARDGENDAELSTAISSLDLKLKDIEARLRATNPRYATLTAPAPLNAREIQKNLLDADTLLLEYALGDERSYLWVVGENSFASYELPNRDDIEAAARRVYELLNLRNAQKRQFVYKRDQSMSIAEAEKAFPAAVAALSQMLLAPAAAHLGNKRLIIVADGLLQYIPFAALSILPAQSTNYQPLMLKHEIVYLPSASTLAILRDEQRARKPATRTMAVIADPVFEKEDDRVKNLAIKIDKPNQQPSAPAPAPPKATEQRILAQIAETEENDKNAKDASLARPRIRRLPFTRQEAESILALAGEQSLRAFDFQANKASATSAEMSDYRYIHFATHGYADSERPELSALILSLIDEKGAAQNGFLRANEIFNLSLSADMVTLSACDTGLGKEVQGEGLVGLTRSFMYAGAARVVVSLWSINDKATAELMTKFYRKMLLEKQRPAAALRAAQVEMWQDTKWQSPFYWAPFILNGEWR